MQQSQKNKTLIRFSEKTKKDVDDGCWLWIGSILKTSGYGQFWLDGAMRLAHRISYELHIGSIPENKLVLHKCDNRKCVNPDHLFLGTYSDNNNDMYAKGRGPDHKGSKCNFSKLKEEDVAVVKHLGKENLTQGQIAKIVGATRSNINKILRGKTWAHILA